MALVKLRNQIAHKLGFKNYHVMQLSVSEQSQEQVLKLLDELDALMRGPFHAAKAEWDAQLARHCGVTAGGIAALALSGSLLPRAAGGGGWPLRRGLCHVGHPAGFAAIFMPASACRSTTCFIAAIFTRRAGKSPHAFCYDLDRRGDVRVLTNLVPNSQWLATMLHELGHSAYSSKNMPDSVPYVLRIESHMLTTEGVAMMFGRLADNAAWLKAMGVASCPMQKRFRRTAAKAAKPVAGLLAAGAR